MLSKEQIEQIVQMTLAQLNKNCPAENQAGGNGWMFERAEDCIEAAQKAQKKLVAMTMEQRESLIAAMRQAARDNAKKLAQMAP